MNRRDLWLVGGVLTLAAVLFLVFGTGKMGNQVVITLDGKEYGRYPLSAKQQIKVESERGYNEVVIENGKVFVKEADCPDHYCEKQGEISDTSSSLICLPHKMVVTIEGDSEKDAGNVDGIAQ